MQNRSKVEFKGLLERIPYQDHFLSHKVWTCMVRFHNWKGAALWLFDPWPSWRTEKAVKTYSSLLNAGTLEDVTIKEIFRYLDDIPVFLMKWYATYEKICDTSCEDRSHGQKSVTPSNFSRRSVRNFCFKIQLTKRKVKNRLQKASTTEFTNIGATESSLNRTCWDKIYRFTDSVL